MNETGHASKASTQRTLGQASFEDGLCVIARERKQDDPRWALRAHLVTIQGRRRWLYEVKKPGRAEGSR